MVDFRIYAAINDSDGDIIHCCISDNHITDTFDNKTIA